MTLSLHFRTLAIAAIASSSSSSSFVHLLNFQQHIPNCFLFLGKVSESVTGTTSQALVAFFLSYLFFSLLSHGPTFHIGRWFFVLTYYLFIFFSNNFFILKFFAWILILQMGCIWIEVKNLKLIKWGKCASRKHGNWLPESVSLMI